MLKFRELKENEIDVRVAQCGDGWAQLLLYKDARVDMAILDETVGTENWSREHYECKGNLFCRVGINVNYNKPELEERWVFKSDCGSESNTEKEKGESSDSFKRACVNFGIGRELYTRIPIFVNVQTKPNGKGGFMIADRKERFTVKTITINKASDKILYLEIMNKNGQVIFKWRNSNAENYRQATISEEDGKNSTEIAPAVEQDVNEQEIKTVRKTRVKRQ